MTKREIRASNASLGFLRDGCLKFNVLRKVGLQYGLLLITVFYIFIFNAIIYNLELNFALGRFELLINYA